jgi:hypothetical protein
MVMPSQNERTSYPLDTLIDFAWASGADMFWVNNAKDELKRLRKSIDEINNKLAQPVAYARINSSGDLYDLKLQNNPYVDQNTVVPLYRIS